MHKRGLSARGAGRVVGVLLGAFVAGGGAASAHPDIFTPKGGSSWLISAVLALAIVGVIWLSTRRRK
ncbi:MAG: hypothetical protein H6873_11485 [Hyphomicrobiaceae bacterium]|nr:hypothetical protein [Hyphomicrobiaceae bacterium]